MTIFSLLSEGKEHLSQLDEGNLIAEILLRHTLQVNPSYLWAHPNQEVNQDDGQRYRQLINRAHTGEPLAYIVGYRQFYGHDFTVTPDTLIPRPESEQLVDMALEHLQDKNTSSPTIVDVGTGSGCIAISIAHQMPQAHLYAIDISNSALKVAQHNANKLGVTNVTFLQGSLLEPLSQIIPHNSVDIIVANLPYISTSEYKNLPQNIQDFEPKSALISGPTPDELNSQLLKQAPLYLKPTAPLLYETTNGHIVESFPNNE